MLKLRADQDDLVAPVAWSLADAYTMPDIAWPRLIYDGDQLVGFMMAESPPRIRTRCSTATCGGSTSTPGTRATATDDSQ